LESFVALITPLGGGGAPGAPTHPIAPGGTPPGFSPPTFPSQPIVIPPDALRPGLPSHPIYLPPPAPGHPIVIPPDAVEPGTPSHPIVILPPGIWGGGGVGNYPDQGLPGGPPLGTWGGGGVGEYPDQGLPGQPGGERPSTQPLPNIMMWTPGGRYVLYTPAEGASGGQVPTPPEATPNTKG